MSDLDPAASRSVIPAFRVAGFVGPFRDWGVQALRELLAQTGHDLVIVDHLTDDHPAVQMLVGLDHASHHSELPLAAFIDAPGQALQALVASGGDEIGHTREMTAVLAGLSHLSSRANAVTIRRDYADDLPGTTKLLIDFLGLAGGDIVPAPPASLELGALTRQIAAELLTPMTDSVVSGVRQSFLLPRDCLLCRTHDPAAPVVDVAGPARPLYFGPFFHFPAGSWQVELELWFSDDVGDASFAAELFTGVLLSRARMRPGRGGWFRAEFPVQIDHPEIPIELRIWVERGAIEGRMGLRQIKFVPVTPTS